MWHKYISVSRIDEAMQILAEQKEKARIIAGATDLMLEMERGVRRDIETLVDITRVPDLDQIMLDEDGIIHLGALVTHGLCASSKLIIEQAYPLARAAWEVGAPQIRNRGTIAGNLITASPANDTIPPLMALDANVVLGSLQGTRNVALRYFYTGVRRTVMRADEIMMEINFKALQSNQRGTFYKLGLRRAQAISLVNAAVLLTFDGNVVNKAAITLGSVAPTIVHAEDSEAYLIGKVLDNETIAITADLAKNAANAITDFRSSKDYRMEMVRVCVLRSLNSLKDGQEKSDYPQRPIQLRTIDRGLTPQYHTPHTYEFHIGKPGQAISTRINGREYTFTNGFHKSLLRLLREEAGLIGTKEGCAEGECGACTVFLDGTAVMSCLVPAQRAHGAEIITIEGISRNDKIHPVQQAFIDHGAVQCGYCTPGFVMSAVMLLNELPDPSRDEIKQAISGNLCRCTGYYSIITAIEQAAKNKGGA